MTLPASNRTAKTVLQKKNIITATGQGGHKLQGRLPIQAYVSYEKIAKKRARGEAVEAPNSCITKE